MIHIIHTQNTSIRTEGLDVSYSDGLLQIKPGAYVNQKGTHEFESSSFDVDSSVDCIYDLYIVDGPEGYDYYLIQTLEGIAVYEGESRLVHNYINIRVSEGNVQIFVYPISDKDSEEVVNYGQDEAPPSQEKLQ
jgi:hypothetical protein